MPPWPLPHQRDAELGRVRHVCSPQQTEDSAVGRGRSYKHVFLVRLEEITDGGQHTAECDMQGPIDRLGDRCGARGAPEGLCLLVRRQFWMAGMAYFNP